MTQDKTSDRLEEEIVVAYQRRREEHDRRADHAESVARWLGVARLTVFVGTILVAYVTWSRGALSAAIVVVGTIAFGVLVMYHNRHRDVGRQARARSKYCTHGIARVRRDWDAIPDPRFAVDVTQHPFADDLYVFGPASVAKLLGPLGAITGKPVMREWLLAATPPPLDVMRERQAAVSEITPKSVWRETLAVFATRSGTSVEALERFLAWAESTEGAVDPMVLRTAVLLTGLTIVFAIASSFDERAWRFLGIALLANVAITLAWRRRTTTELTAISSRGFDWTIISRMFEHIGSERHEAPLLASLQERAATDKFYALRSLARIQTCGELRYSPMGWVVVQVLTLWDFHVVAALHRWRRDHGRHMRERLVALGEIEALASLATLAYENPNWTFPTLGAGASVDAKNLAHPLLAPSLRVGNDVAVGPPGTFLLVTGSNMAGKSTLLRAVAANVLLAQLGAPVCASSLSLPRVRLRTAMHVRDSIASGASLFMAELLRIREVVDAARDSTAPRLLYIADEILHGTNTEDRRVAIRAILLELLACGAIGMLATHLDGLDTDARLGAHARAVHFSEQYRQTEAGPVMTFDYRLRAGAATSSNALRLLQTIGLPETHAD